MKRINLLILVLFLFSSSFAQNKITDAFSASELQNANTAQSATYFSEEEQQVILIMNLVRLYPEKFRDEVLKPYVEFSAIKKNKYYNSLLQDLKSAKPTTPIKPHKTLYDEASEHAISMGKKGKTGHNSASGKSFNSRMKPLLDDFASVGENCQYGYNTAIAIVIDLLIDDGIPSLGHRKNIMNSNFQYAGVRIAYHKNYTYNCVIDFGGELK